MLPDTITLAIDEANTDSTTDHDLARAIESANKSTYWDEDHTVAARNEMSVFRTFPKTSGNFYGSLKTSVKFTKDIAVDGVDGSTLKVPLIGEASFSMPVGTTEEEATLLRQSLIAMLDRDDVMDLLHGQGMI